MPELNKNVDVKKHLDSMAKDLTSILSRLRDRSPAKTLMDTWKTSSSKGYIPEVKINIFPLDKNGRRIDDPSLKDSAEMYSFTLNIRNNYHHFQLVESENQIDMRISAKATPEELKNFQKVAVISTLKELNVDVDTFKEACAERIEQKKATENPFNTSYQASIK